MNLHIWTALGMGDHITCNGLVRHYASQYDEITLFVKTRNLSNVKRMLRDLNNIEYVSGVGEQDQFVKYYLDIHPAITLLKTHTYSGNGFDKRFYELAHIPHEYKWSKFYIERDLNKEKEVFNDIMGLEIDEEYVFTHRGNFGWDVQMLNVPNIRSINPNDYPDISIFDFGMVIERAKEVHIANSSFLCLIDCMQLEGDITYHSYIRPGCDPITNKNIKVI